MSSLRVVRQLTPEGWTVVQSSTRGSIEVVAGPYRTRLEAEVVARQRSKVALDALRQNNIIRGDEWTR